MRNIENQTVKERLKSFIKHKKISVRAFESTCGLSYGFVGNMRNSMQPSKVTKITHCFPELNMGWLLTGEGEMLKQPQRQVNIRNFTNSGENAMGDFFNITAPVNDHKASDELAIAKAEIKLLQELLNEKNERINELHEMITLLKNK